MNKIDEIWIYVRIVWKFSLNWKNVSRLFTIAMKIQVSRCFLDTEESMQRYLK